MPRMPILPDINMTVADAYVEPRYHVEPSVSHEYARFLNFAWRDQLSIDTIMSIRPTGKDKLHARFFYRTWLYYWPIDFGELVLLQEPQVTSTSKLVSCLRSLHERLRCDSSVKVRVAPLLSTDMYTNDSKANGSMNIGKLEARFHIRDSKVKWNFLYAMQMQGWKFDADKIVPQSTDIIAFVDDDSCPFDHLLPSEIVTDDGKLVARGWRCEPSGAKFCKEVMKPINISCDPCQQFMTDFPVYIWRDMLLDFREHVITSVLGAEAAKGNGDTKLFWHAIFTAKKRSDAAGSDYTLQDYGNLLNFAYHSPKWRAKYDWQILGSHTEPILSHSNHHKPCPLPPGGRTVRTRDATKFAAWTQRGMLYPYSLGTNFDKYPWSSMYNRILKNHSKAWNIYLRERQRAIAYYAQKRNVSAIDACGKAVVSGWERCFDAVRLCNPPRSCSWDKPAP